MRNPYDFVRIDWDSGVERRSPRLHHRFEGLSGRLKGTITTLTPFFIPGEEVRKAFQDPYKRALTGPRNCPIIPGSSLKGRVRGLVETVGYGCWCFPKSAHYYKIPGDFRACTDSHSLCVACRMFGMVDGDDNLAGHVGFEDAVCKEPQLHKRIYTPILMGPQEDRASWYLDDSRRRVAGRKFYYHSQGVWVDDEIQETGSGQELNSYIEPLDAGNVFTFEAYFDNLTEDEFRLLVYVLTLEPEMRHKLGYAKPAGLGSVEIALTKIRLIDFESRYTTSSEGVTVYQGADLEAFVSEQTASQRRDRACPTLESLRHIWAWPPSDTLYGYQAWEMSCERLPVLAADSGETAG